MQCQEQETALHQAFLDKVAEEVQTLQRKQASTVAKTTEYRRKLVELEHRLLQVHSYHSISTSYLGFLILSL